MKECCLLTSEEYVAESNMVASNEKDGPSAVVEASDEAPLKSKDELDKIEDAASTPASVQEQKQSPTVENGKIEGTSCLCFHLSYLFKSFSPYFI